MRWFTTGQASGLGGPTPRRCAAAGATSRRPAETASRADDCFVMRFGTELEPAAGDFRGDHPHVAKLYRCGPRPQLRSLGLFELGAGRQHMRAALDDYAPPVRAGGIVVVGFERDLVVHHGAE